jgi:hypothetical protein
VGKLILDFNYSYFAWFGTLYLILLAYQDFKNNKVVDDRRNFLMLGITISLVTHVPSSLWYKLSLAVFIIALGWLLRKYKIFGKADVNTFTWMFLGVGLISVFKLFWFLVIFGIIVLLYMILKQYLFKIKEPTAFYGVILTAFIVSSILLGLY